jgi:hypothetical protein
MRTFLFILIVTSGMQILGYALVDVLLIGCFLLLIMLSRRGAKLKIDVVFIFCGYMVIQSLRGMYVLGDFRMIYWVLFFIIVYFSYLYLIDLSKNSKVDLKFARYVFNFSMVYFLVYGLLPIFMKNPDDYQGIYWAGSSAAFIIVIPLLCSHFVLFKNAKHSLSSLRLPSLLIYLAVTIVHYSRMGMYLLFFYIIYLVFTSFTFSIKRISLITVLLGASVFVLDFTRQSFYTDPTATGATEIAQIESIFSDDSSLEDTSSDLDRFMMVVSVYNKWVSSPVEFVFGSGWYTSRYTLKPFEAETVSRFGLNGFHISSDEPLQVTSFAAILSDTGIVGLFFFLYFFLMSSKQILKGRSKGALVFLGYLWLNLLFYLVGNSFISIIGFLLIFPNGLLVGLSRALPHSNKLVKREDQNA